MNKIASINTYTVKKNILTAVISLFMISTAISQDIQTSLLSSAGSVDSTDQYIVEWTVGEPLIETYSAGDFFLTQGLLQYTYLIEQTQQTEPPEDIQFNVSCFPNPAIDKITVRIESENQDEKYIIQLEDLSGRTLLKTETPPNKDNNINISAIYDAQLFLKISNSSKKAVKTFKVIKLNPNN